MSEPKNQEIGSNKDAWARFERAVDAVVKSGPKHKVALPAGVDKKERPASTGRVHKGKAKN